MATPRIRPELQATPAETDGIKYFDVNDPKSGHKMRLYDFEWLVAQRMDGHRPFDEVATWAKERLGIAPTAADLEDYAQKLREYGFLEEDTDDYTPLPAAMPAAELGGNGEAARERVAAEQQFEEESPTIPRVSTTTDIKPEAKIAVEEPTGEPVEPVYAEPKKHPFAPRETGSVVIPPNKVPKKSGAASIIGILMVLVLVGAGVVYYTVILPNQAVHVSVMLASPSEVVRLYDGAAAVQKAEPQALSFGENGKIADVVAQGTDVKPGMPLATLDSYAKIEKELGDVKDRAAFYEKQLTAAKAKNDEPAIKAAEAKVAEKQKMTAELEAKAGKVRILAPGTGTVSEVLATAGEDAKAGAPVIKIADKRMTVEFKLPAADAAALKPGAAVQLTPAARGATLAGRVTKSGNGAVTVELLDDTAAKPGDSLRLVKSKLQNVVKVPATAIVKRDGADTVFVLSDGEAKSRKVTVVDHDGADALVSTGLATGDSVITTGVDTLTDGKKATTQQ